MRLIVAITGATGSILGVELLKAVRRLGKVETHLIISKWGLRTLLHETSLELQDLRELAAQTYRSSDMGAAISSGSFLVDGMVIIPCSMRTVASIATGTGDNLIHRAADVTLKERRRLVLAPRETPLSEIHLENLLKLARMGVRIVPPMLAFYHQPRTLEDMIEQTVTRVLDQLAIETDSASRWTGSLRTEPEEDKVHGRI